MRQLVNGLASSQIRINPAGPDKAKQTEELTRTTKCQDGGYRLAREIINLLRSLSMQQGSHNKKPGYLARLITTFGIPDTANQPKEVQRMN
jgi:hypothetical protein